MTDVRRAVAAALATARRLGLGADDAAVLQASSKVTLRLLPCDVVARVATGEGPELQRELDLAVRLVAAGSPVAAPDPRVEPRVHETDDVALSLWTYYPSVGSSDPAGYAAALVRLHHGMRGLPFAAPHFTDRVRQARALVEDPGCSPGLPDEDRALLVGTLRTCGQAVAGSGRPEQLLHGEPHPGNLLPTADGPLFVDLETCCRGPVEFDLAHAPDDVAPLYPDVDETVLQECRLLVLAMVTAWRWDPDDRLPDGRRLAAEWISSLREASGGPPARRTSGPPAPRAGSSARPPPGRPG